MVTPLGVGAVPSWNALLSGHRGGRCLTKADIDCFHQLTDLLKRTPGGAPVDHFEVAAKVREFAATDAHLHAVADAFSDDCLNNLIMASLLEAIADAGLTPNQLAGDRTACVIGTSKASLRAMESEFHSMRGGRQLEAAHWKNAFLSDAPLRCAQQMLNAIGPALCPVAACATGLVSVIQGAALIRTGQADICVTGSADASLRSSVLASFHRLGVTSKRDNPATACRPFDRDRDGFVIGEGAAILILESRKHADSRGARTHGKLVAGGWLTDPTGITQIDSSGALVAKILDHSDSKRPLPEFIGLHGTGTITNDLAEANGVADAFGAGFPPCFGVKGSIGHLLGAAGSVELGLTLLALSHRVIPPTVNTHKVDEACRINVSPNVVPNKSVRTAIKLSLGFGGHVAATQVSVEPAATAFQSPKTVR